jgi:membrane carboxypeptidase/penicillin-binding protein PbpC
MLLIPAMTVLCTAGVAFYVRFLVALCKECAPRRSGYWLRLRLGSREATIVELQRARPPLTRVA